MVFIGIDLGTTHSCVGWWKDNRCEIIANDQGFRLTPSCVAFTPDEELVGNSALNQVSQNPLNTILNAKRFIGKQYDTREVQQDKERVSYHIVKGEENRPLVQLTCRKKQVSFEEISAMILTHMKKIAENYTGQEVTGAVVTVPAYFNDEQRQATRKAGSIANLTILRIINEPTAAAIAYGLDKKDCEKNILVYDIGGGTLDVSLVTMSEGIFEVKATSGKSHLGGEDFDQLLLNYCLQQIQDKYKKDIRENKRAVSRLKKACEKAKRSLSVNNTTSIEVDSLYEGNDYQMSLTRAKFESLCVSLFDQCQEPIIKVIEDSESLLSDITNIVMVGGSSRIPKIQQDIRDCFPEIPLCFSINPDEAIAYGAAAQAAALSQSTSGKELVDDMLLLDVTPLSLGVETEGNQMTKVIHRNTTIPTQQTQIFSTLEDNQSYVVLRVFQGERAMTYDNHLLGTFRLEGISLGPRGTPQIEVEFQINTDGIVTITASEKKSGAKTTLTIQQETRRLSTEEVHRRVTEAELYQQEDNKQIDTQDLKNKFKSYLTQITHAFQRDVVSQYIQKEKLQLIINEIKEKEHWISTNPSYSELQTQFHECEKKWNTYLSEIHAQISLSEINSGTDKIQ